jgi:anti-anti-sigma factor
VWTPVRESVRTGSNAGGAPGAFWDMTAACEVWGSTVRLRGELDIATLGEVESALADALRASEPEVIVDVSGTTFVDSTTIGALLDARAAADRAGRTVRLRGVGPRFERLLGLCEPQPPFERAD